MNTLPPSQIPVYGQLWTQADADGDGVVGQSDALSFFSKSGLPDYVLGSIWTQVNPQGALALSADQFVYACQLIAMGQAGSTPDLNQLLTISATGVEIPLPTFAPANLTGSTPGLQSSGPGTQVWATTECLHLWMQHFQEQDADRDGYVGGEVTAFLQQSGLPVTTLGTIWTMADVNGDGRLDVQEFCAAMALIAGLKEGKQLPSALPASLVQLVWPNGLPDSFSAVAPVGVSSLWTITPDESQTDKQTFLQHSIVGYIEGNAAVTLFSQSGVPVEELAHVYTLADLDGDGRLREHEFLIAMKLIRVRMGGTALPATLPPELLSSGTTSSSGGISNQAGNAAELQQQVINLQAQVAQLQMERDLAIQQRDEKTAIIAQLESQLAAKAGPTAHPFGGAQANPFGGATANPFAPGGQF